MFAVDASLPAERLVEYRREYGIAGMHRLALFAADDYAKVGSVLMTWASVAETPGDAASLRTRQPRRGSGYSGFASTRYIQPLTTR